MRFWLQYWRVHFFNLKHTFWGSLKCTKAKSAKRLLNHHDQRSICNFSLETLLVRDNRVFYGPLGCSLWSLAHTANSAHSTHSLRSNPLCSAALRFAPQHSALLHCARLLRPQARSLTPLTPLWDSWNSWICVHAANAFHRYKRRFSSSLGTHPWCWS